MMYRCPNCDSAHVTVYQDATAEYEQDDDGNMILVDTLPFDHIEGLSCRTCNYAEGGPGDSDGPSTSDWEERP